MLIPHRTSGVEESTLPPDYRRVLAAVRQAAGPVMARQVGDMLGTDVSVRAKPEPLRGKLVRLFDRGWLRKLPDGRFTADRAATGRRPWWQGRVSRAEPRNSVPWTTSWCHPVPHAVTARLLASCPVTAHNR